MAFTKTEFNEWRAHPVTAGFLAYLKDLKSSMAEQMADGATLNAESAENTLAMTARMVGEMAGIQTVIAFIERREANEQ